MILHRFCSQKEFEAYKRGEVLSNPTNHSVKRGGASTSVGFCFFPENPERAKHWLSGIVDFDVCITVEVNPSDVVQSRGRYLGAKKRVVYKKEYCTVEYDNRRFKLIDATTKYSTYAPNHSLLKQMFPAWFV